MDKKELPIPKSLILNPQLANGGWSNGQSRKGNYNFSTTIKETTKMTTDKREAILEHFEVVLRGMSTLDDQEEIEGLSNFDTLTWTRMIKQVEYEVKLREYNDLHPNATVSKLPEEEVLKIFPELKSHL
jgi:hypothetical protein